MAPLLEVADLGKRFGGLWAVRDVSFDLEQGVILGLIGPNGSGKTTTLNLLGGVHRPDRGRIRLRGGEIAGLPTYAFAHGGVARTFQNARVFSTITTYENMLVPTLHLDLPARQLQERALGLLAFVGLEDKQVIAASELSGGQQKLLEFARALMTGPDLVLMDEPFAGVHPSIKALLLERIRERNAQGTAFLVVSHEIPDLLNLCDRVICMNQGAIIAAGTPEEVREDEQVVEAYLGRPLRAGGRS